MRFNSLKPYLSTLASTIAIVLYPCLFIYFINIEQSKVTDIFGMVGLFLANAVLIFVLAFFWLRDFHKAGILTNIILLLIQNFSLIEKGIASIFPAVYYWHIVLIIIFVAGNLGIITQRVLAREKALKINTILFFIFGGLIVFNALSVTPKIYRLMTEKTGATELQVELSDNINNVNVYYFIFDEYGGLDCLERYCGYDNSPFYQSLEELGFNVSKNSRNGTYQSTVEIPNLLNLDHVNNEYMTHEAMVAALENPYLFRLFSENGYALNVFHSHVPYMPIDDSISDYLFEVNKGVVEDTLQYYILQKTIYYPLTHQSSGKKITEINNMFQYARESWKLQPNNLLTFGYFYFPHLPWFVDEFGNRMNVADAFNWRNSDAYLGQLKYCNTKIIEMVTEIIEKDPQSIIIIQSDHGYRRPVFLEKEYGETIEDMDAEMPYMLNILNAVYYRGEKIEIESLTGLDTLRTVLNHHFDMELDMIGTGAGQ